MPRLYRVRISPRALSDMEEIFRFIAQDSPWNAARMIERLLDAIDGLEFMPYRFKAIEEVGGKDVRSIPVRPYLIRFRVEEQTGIVRILHVVTVPAGRKDEKHPTLPRLVATACRRFAHDLPPVVS